MLIAIRKNKAKLFLMGIRLPKRRPREDLITDAVFGALLYFNKTEAAQLFNFAFSKIQKRKELPELSHIEKIELWERSGDCEPDVVLCGNTSSGAVKLVIEVKFDDKLGEGQVRKQQKRFIRNSSRSRVKTFHVFVVKQEVDVADAVRNSEIGTLVLWQDIQQGLQSATSSSGATLEEHQLAWINGVRLLLDFLLRQIFTGHWSNVTGEFALPAGPSHNYLTKHLFFDSYR